MAKVGVWLVGAQGSLESTVVLGARALARRLAAGGGLVARLEGDLEAVEARVRPGFADGGGPANRPHRSRSFLPRSESLVAAVERLGDDLDRFRSDQKLDTVIVVNVASTEPPLALLASAGEHGAFRGLTTCPC